MIKTENYPNAYKEVYVILNSMEEKDIKMIPESFIQMIKEKMNNEYEFALDENINFDNQKLLYETKTILAYIFTNYWATEEERNTIQKKFRQDIINKEKQKPKYSPDELFKTNKIIKNITDVKSGNNEQLVEYNPKNIFVRIINAIKRLFRKK